MKNNIKSLILITLFAPLAFSACNKDNDNVSNQSGEMTEQEAVATSEIIVSSATEDLEAASKVADDYSSADENQAVGYCGLTFDTTWTLDNAYGNASGTYTSAWALTVICNNLQVPTALEAASDGNGNFETNIILGNEAAQGAYSLEGLLPNATSYTVNGSFTSSGSLSSKVGFHNSFTYDATVTLTDVSISKTTYTIESGTGTLTLVAVAANGQSVTFNGEITFNGDGTATLVINSKTYTINL